MLKSIKIGNVTIPNNIILAPMAGVTDLPFRILCRENGCGLAYTEMISAKGLMYNNENTKKLLETKIDDRPIVVQLFGSDPQILADAAKKINMLDIDIIDINMGCPTPKITKNGEGSALMRTPKLIGEIIYAVSNASNKPVTVKIRKGFDTTSINAVEIAKIVEKNGAKAIAIHGRTREQFYSGQVDLEIIAKVKAAVQIPVIGNGDITTLESAEAMFAETNCDAIMIGRGACGNPWIFSSIAEYFKTGVKLSPPTLNEKLRVAIKHTKALVASKGEYIGIREARKHLAWYVKGIKGSSELKKSIFSAESLSDFERIFAGIVDIHFPV